VTTPKTGKPVGRPKGAVNLSTREMKAKAQGYGDEALDVLMTIARDKTQPPEARIKAAEKVLDRGYGKPRQAVQHGGAVGAYDFSRLPDEQLRIVYDGLKAASIDGLGDVDA
jgi:hypothetical protein